MSELVSAFVAALIAAGPVPDRAGDVDLYGWLVGSWALDVTEFLDDGSRRRRPGEWHFAWVLEGRMIQDVWIVPARGARGGGGEFDYYGTTLRVYDPRIDAWRIQYTDPVVQAYLTMVGRPHGDDIVQEGNDSTGQSVRWSFSDITQDSFRWTGEWSADHGATWRLRVAFIANRVAPRPSA